MVGFNDGNSNLETGKLRKFLNEVGRGDFFRFALLEKGTFEAIKLRLNQFRPFDEAAEFFFCYIMNHSFLIIG